MTTLEKIYVMLVKLILLTVAKIVRKRWYSAYQSFEYRFIHVYFVTGTIDTALIVPSSALKSLKGALSYVMSNPLLWDEENEVSGDSEEEEYEEHDDSDYPDDENRGAKLIFDIISNPECQRFIQEHPDVQKFLY